MTKEEDDDLPMVEIYVKLKGIWDFLWAKKNIIIITGLIGGVLGLLLSIVYPAKYQSDLTFIVEESGSSSGLSSLAGIASSFGIGGLTEEGGLYGSGANLMNYLKTRAIMEEALLSEIPKTKKSFAQEFIEKYKWDSEIEVKPGVFKKISFPIHENRKEFPVVKDSLLKEMYIFLIDQNCVALSKPDDDGNIILLQVISKSNLFSRYFSEELLKIVSEKYIKDKTKKARYNVDIIQKQTDSVKNVLNGALLNAASITDQVFGLNPALNVQRVPATKEQIDIQVSSAVLTELIKNLELSKVQLLHTTPLIQIIDNPRYPLGKIEISKVKGIILGGILFGFLIVAYLIIRKFITEIKAESIHFYTEGK